MVYKLFSNRLILTCFGLPTVFVVGIKVVTTGLVFGNWVVLAFTKVTVTVVLVKGISYVPNHDTVFSLKYIAT